MLQPLNRRLQAVGRTVARANLTILFTLASVIGCALALASEGSSPERASAHLDFRRHTSFYSYTDSACKFAVDPVSVVFYRNATLANVDQHASHHNGWTYHSESTQYFYDHHCSPMDNQNASGDFWQTRYHMREWWNWDSKNGYYTLATPHHEEMTWCGHASSGEWDAMITERGKPWRRPTLVVASLRTKLAATRSTDSI